MFGMCDNRDASTARIRRSKLVGRGMEILPDAEGREEFTQRMRFAWLLTQESFELEAPAQPGAECDFQELEAWSEQTLRRWLNQKNRLVEAARAELDLAAEENHTQRVWAGALVGLMYEDVRLACCLMFRCQVI